MTETATRYRALCCGCGTPRTVDRNYYGLSQYQHLSDRRSSEPHWRGLRSLKCKTCKAWTRHAMIFDGQEWQDKDERFQETDGQRFSDSAACLAYIEGLGVDVRIATQQLLDSDGDVFVAQVSQFFNTQGWLVTYNALMAEEHLLSTLHDIVKLLKKPDQAQWYVYDIGTDDASRGASWVIDDGWIQTAVAGAADRMLDSEALG